MAEDLPNDDDLRNPPSFFDFSEPKEHEPTDLGEPMPVRVEGVFSVRTANGVSHLVLLTDGEQKLSISIGAFEALSIDQALRGTHPDRPITHDLMKTLVDRLGATVSRVVIDDIWNGIYYAKIFIQVEDEVMEIDARPSDAIALAVRFKAGILVRLGVFEAADGE